MSGALVGDLGIGPDIWLVLSLLCCVTLFFKFSRIWSVRNLDLLLLFALTPGMMGLVGNREAQPWGAFVLLFLGSGLWLIRCLVDLGMPRRPLLEPNLNAAGLACLSIGVLVLLLLETVSLPLTEGAARNPAEPGGAVEPPPAVSPDAHATVKQIFEIAPLPDTLRPEPLYEILKRVLASLSHFGLVSGLIAVGWRHFERPIAGLAVATCYLLLPYTRMALVDSGQLVPAALVVGALVAYNRPAIAGALIGMAAGWMPACLGLVALWAGFYRGRGAVRFAAVGLGVVAMSAALARAVPGLAVWSRALGARSLAAAGLLYWPESEIPHPGSFWAGLDATYRLPVLIAYLALVLFTTFWPADKNLGELIALSAALLVASQFWFLDEGGALVLLYLPLVLLMMFRPNLSAKRPYLAPPRIKDSPPSLFPIR